MCSLALHWTEGPSGFCPSNHEREDGGSAAGVQGPDLRQVARRERELRESNTRLRQPAYVDAFTGIPTGAGSMRINRECPCACSGAERVREHQLPALCSCTVYKH